MLHARLVTNELKERYRSLHMVNDTGSEMITLAAVRMDSRISITRSSG